ncbi:MAG TPA: serine/threonine-protein kinase, partial [Planctomycetota bacterium]|nr:serine/threonine-protein kinase [Planctomycetota bacterium]
GILLPYMAMELVEGERVDRWARRPDVTLRRRLELLADLCDAVHHAHQKGVVHRDLKPANVLVTREGRPVVLDFGIARLTREDDGPRTLLTHTGDVIGTLPYMSPEQVAGDPAQIDIRTDVYALGAIAYEVLVGERPLELGRHSLPEAARAIAEDEPSSLGTLDRELRGDVETIVAKALAKEKERRYASAEELAGDLRRHLRHEPIEARRSSRSYQLAKFARRNRVLVGGLAAVLVSLALGLVVSREQYLRAEERGIALAAALENEEHAGARARAAEAEARAESERAVEHAAQSEELSRFLVTLFDIGRAEDPDWSSNTPWTLQRLVDRGSARILDDLTLSPRTRVEVLQLLGECQFGIGRMQQAADLLERAHREVAGLQPPDPALAVDLAISLAQARHLLADHRGELELAEATLAYAEEHGVGDRERARCLRSIGSARLDLKDVPGARLAIEQGLALLETIPPPVTGMRVDLLNALGWLLFYEDAYEDSDRAFAEAIEAAVALDPERDGESVHWGVLAMLYSSRALVRREMEDYDVSEALCFEGLEVVDRHGGEDYVHRNRLLLGLVSVAKLRGDFEGAEALCDETLEQMLRTGWAEHPNLATVYIERGDVRAMQGRLEEAAQDLAESLRLTLQVGEPDLGYTTRAVAGLDAVLSGLARELPPETMRRQVESVQAVLGDWPPDLAHWAQTDAQD